MKAISSILRRIEAAEALDPIAKPIIETTAKAVRPRLVRNLASGTPLGHPAHPMLTDLPIGAFTMAALLDVVGGAKSAPAADLLVRAGLLSSVPTVATGLNDFSDTYGAETRIGLTHAGVNGSALLLYCLSGRARARGHRGRGKLLGLVALGTLVAGSYLGGHLSFTKGTNVNRTAWEHAPEDWTAVLPDADLADGEHRRVDAGGVAVLLSRSGGGLSAISATCSHMGGPLDEGTFADGCVTCPWHGSTFRLSDGGIERGPACVEQPVFDTRVQDGQIEVRAATS
ncbi:MAG: iron-sulfur protein [Jatrophihabitans sp.]|nr:MAG: iron-sulfur protein [Jatrophihabitans sp.]